MRCCYSYSYSLVLVALVSTAVTPTSASIDPLPSTKKRWPKKPWEYHTDPNPNPSIAELEETTSIDDIDEVLNRVVGTNEGIIIQRYKPEPTWLWRQWFGTVIYSAWPRALINMAWATAFCFFVRYQTHGDFDVWALPDLADDPFVARFKIADKIWLTLMSLTTFLLTFFVGQSYSFWRSFYDVGRSIQGRLNNILMLLGSHAARDTKTGRYTPEAQDFLHDIAKQLQLFHLLHWASHANRFRVLLTSKGWDQMVVRGLVTEAEKDRLHQLDTPATQKHCAVLQSMIATSQKAVLNSKIVNSHTLGSVLVTEFSQLRGTTGTIPDLIAGRMPLAYAHFVQLLVDTFVVCTPIAKYVCGILHMKLVDRYECAHSPFPLCTQIPRPWNLFRTDDWYTDILLPWTTNFGHGLPRSIRQRRLLRRLCISGSGGIDSREQFSIETMDQWCGSNERLIWRDWKHDFCNFVSEACNPFFASNIAFVSIQLLILMFGWLQE